MSVFEIMSRYFWAIAIFVTCVNVVSLKRRSRRHIEANPELAKGYATLIRGYLLWMNIPWVVMGLGCTIGGIPAVWYFFRPRDGNPYVLAWFRIGVPVVDPRHVLALLQGGGRDASQVS